MAESVPVIANQIPEHTATAAYSQQKSSFANIVKGNKAVPKLNPASKNLNKSFLDARDTESVRIVPFKTGSTFKGRPAVFFSKAEIDILSEPLKYTLVGKFSHGILAKAELHKCIANLGLKGNFSLGYVDKKHVLISLDLEEDYSRLWLRRDWNFLGFPMRVFKWTPTFRPDVESSLVPIWISFPHLPFHLFHKDSLDSIAALVGKPLRIDEPTAKSSRPSFARVCVEVDLLKELPTEVWIGDEETKLTGYFQKVIYENIPKYCTCCNHLGHDKTSCYAGGNKEMQKSSDYKEKQPELPEKVDVNVDQHVDKDLRYYLEKKRGKEPMLSPEQKEDHPVVSKTPGVLKINEPNSKDDTQLSTNPNTAARNQDGQTMPSQESEKEKNNHDPKEDQNILGDNLENMDENLQDDDLSAKEAPSDFSLNAGKSLENNIKKKQQLPNKDKGAHNTYKRRNSKEIALITQNQYTTAPMESGMILDSLEEQTSMAGFSMFDLNIEELRPEEEQTMLKHIEDLKLKLVAAAKKREQNSQAGDQSPCLMTTNLPDEVAPSEEEEFTLVQPRRRKSLGDQVTSVHPPSKSPHPHQPQNSIKRNPPRKRGNGQN